MPATHRRLLDAYGGLEDDAAAVERLWDARREAEAAVASHRAEVERAAREADWLRHAVEELTKLAPRGRRGNRAGRAPRRDDAGARRSRAICATPTTRWPAARRRCRRWRPRCAGWSAAPRRRRPGRAGGARRSTRRSTRSRRRAAISKQALRAADHDPQELERIEERLFALRAAGRKYNSPVDALNALAAKLRRRPRADRCRRRAARGAGKGRAARPQAHFAKAAAALVRGAPQGARRSSTRR